MTLPPEVVAYAERGWHMVPIIAGTKRPAWSDWPRRATTDTAELSAWWEQNPDAGVGIATGTPSGIWVLDIDPRNGGDETLYELERDNAPLEDHYEVLTGGGGRHYYFTLPLHAEGGDSDDGTQAGHAETPSVHAGILGPGLDVKSTGGQVLAPPSIHPDTGRAYQLELSGPEHPRRAPAWLEQLVSSEARKEQAHDPVPREILATSQFAWQRYNGSASNDLTASLMVEMGWVNLGTNRSGIIELQRPDIHEGEGKEGLSATVGAVTSAPGVLYCWTSSVPGWRNEHPYDAAEVLSRARFGGDDEACDDWLTEAGWGAPSKYDLEREAAKWLAHAAIEVQYGGPSDTDPWGDFDIARALNEPPVMPSMMPRSDGMHLLYPNSVTWITAEPESGKTWLALHAVADVLSWGGHVTILDYENGIPLLERAILMGIDPQRLIRQVHLKSFPTSWVDNQERVLGEVQATGSRLVVIDSCQSAMASAGLDPVDNADVARFYDFVRRTTIGGASAVVLDHLRKDDSASSRYPMGAGQKLAQATVALGMERRSAMAPGRTGQAALYLHKDRHGQLRKFADDVAEYQMIGMFELESDILTGQCQARVKPYLESASSMESAPLTPLPYKAMQTVTDLLVDCGGLEGNKLPVGYFSRIGARKADVSIALIELERRQYITVSGNPRYVGLNKAYRADWDPEYPFYKGDET